jgi:aryl-alcohol dehydrogenase-like predicted oxidoreductase
MIVMKSIRPEVALGTVQWGMAYGIANRTGQASQSQVARMLDIARSAGVDTLDTARAYGDAEAVIGRALQAGDGFRLITKLSPTVCDDLDSVPAAVRHSLAASHNALTRETLDVVLLHRPEHRTDAGGAAWSALRQARAAGTVGAIGISATSPETALEALDDSEVGVMQVAASLLDRRLDARGFFERAAHRGVEVHVRSAFLQGVAFMSADALPVCLQAARESLTRIDAWAQARKVSRATVFLAYVFSLPVARIVMGCERPEQLTSNLTTVARARELAPEVEGLCDALPSLPPSVLDPSQWSNTR